MVQRREAPKIGGGGGEVRENGEGEQGEMVEGGGERKGRENRERGGTEGGTSIGVYNKCCVHNLTFSPL